MRSVWQANRFIYHQERLQIHFPIGLCKRKCREAYDIPSDGSRDAKASYANTSHRFTGKWIPGAFAWWQNNGHWHVAICQYRKGWVWSTDVDDGKDGHDLGYWNSIPLTDIHKEWPNCHFVGFTLDIDGKQPVKMPRFPRSYP